MKLPSGKVPIDVLKDVVFKNLGVKRDEVALGPMTGIDGAVINVGNRSLVVSMDPITGAIERIGWLAVNVNANDVATFGCQPAFFLSCILLPENSDETSIEKISTQMNKAATDMGIAIVGGHCEVTHELTNPIVVGCMMGITKKGNYVTAGGARQGDKLILTKSAGIEGTAILASDREKQLKEVMNATVLRSAKQFYKRISIVEDALTAFKTGGVHAMHDPTEGGVAGALYEMADASNLGVKVCAEKIRVEPETLKICDSFGIDPLQLISSGALLISAEAEYSERILTDLEHEGIPASVIGEFTKEKSRVIIRKNGEIQTLPRPVSDHLWTALTR